MKIVHSGKAACCGLYLGLIIGVPAQAATLFQEDFNGITTGYPCGMMSCTGIQNGVPSTGGGTTINGGADEDWYAARFEAGSSAAIIPDVGVQKVGGNAQIYGTSSYYNNPTPVGMFQDDAGLLFKINTTGYTDITLTFDWRTYIADTTDKVTVGYYVGGITGFGSNRTKDLRSGYGTPSWSGWTPLMSATGYNKWHLDETFTLANANNAPEVWVAFWMNDGNNDIGKIDDITVTGTVVPVPPALWLFGSGLLGLFGVSRPRAVSARHSAP